MEEVQGNAERGGGDGVALSQTQELDVEDAQCDAEESDGDSGQDGIALSQTQELDMEDAQCNTEESGGDGGQDEVALSLTQDLTEDPGGVGGQHGGAEQVHSQAKQSRKKQKQARSRGARKTPSEKWGPVDVGKLRLISNAEFRDPVPS